jgi:hypothetical protein
MLVYRVTLGIFLQQLRRTPGAVLRHFEDDANVH